MGKRANNVIDYTSAENCHRCGHRLTLIMDEPVDGIYCQGTVYDDPNYYGTRACRCKRRAA